MTTERRLADDRCACQQLLEIRQIVLTAKEREAVVKIDSTGISGASAAKTIGEIRDLVLGSEEKAALALLDYVGLEEFSRLVDQRRGQLRRGVVQSDFSRRFREGARGDVAGGGPPDV